MAGEFLKHRKNVVNKSKKLTYASVMLVSVFELIEKLLLKV
jgi:hypothetical protein